MKQRETEMKASKLLRMARNKLVMDAGYYQHRFICHCIRSTKAPEKDKQRIKSYIMKSLGSSLTLEGWLVRNGFNNNDDAVFRVKTQTTRLAWMDWMIQQYEAKGD
jgi:superoxide dismutase